VATVAETALGEGRVTVVGRGSTVIRVSSGGVTKEIPVTGRWDVAYLEDIRLVLTTDEEPTGGSDTTIIYTTLSVGDVIDVKASANPRNANTSETDYITFDWKSDNTSMVTITEDAATKNESDKFGTITINSTGTANITISCTLDKDEVDKDGNVIKDADGKPKKVVIKAKTIIIKVS
jgi:hypothetical protein